MDETLSTGNAPEDLIKAITDFATAEDAIRSGRFLFHGTVSDFEQPSPGGYDGVFWTAPTPDVAQTYIPQSGVEALLPWDDFRQNDRVAPAPWDGWWNIVARAMGMDPDAAEAKFDSVGYLKSWRIQPGHPTYREALEFLEAQGYRVDRGTIRIKTRPLGGDVDELLPADYRSQGFLLIMMPPENMHLLDLSRGDGDLMDPDYHRLDRFRMAEEKGYDGVIIDDFAQSKSHGNVGHRSIGFFREALDRIPFVKIPVEAFDWDEMFGNSASTPHFDCWFEEQRSSKAQVAPPAPGF